MADSQMSDPIADGRVLILGGSQGAHAINVAMVAAAAELGRRFPGLEVVHQTGPRDVADVRAGYERAGVAARTESFLDGVAAEMTAADLVVSRAGATTLAELAALGRPAVLVPFPFATDDHQTKNARAVAEHGAAVMVPERELSARLTTVVAELLGDRARLSAMAAAMKTLARPDAASRIVDRLSELVAA